MNYYVDGGHNITTAEEMNSAMQDATALCGFNSCVMEIQKKTYQRSQCIKNITQLHNFQYELKDGKKMCRVWRYYEIGIGKLYELPLRPEAPVYTIISNFREDVTSVGRGIRSATTSKDEIYYCTDEQCLKSMASLEELQRHLDFEVHQYSEEKATQLSKVKDKWVARHQVDRNQANLATVEGITEPIEAAATLPMGWAIKAEREHRRLSPQLKERLDALFEEGERTKNKYTADRAYNIIRNELSIEHIVPKKSINSYFSRKAAQKKTNITVPQGNVVVAGGAELPIQNDEFDDTNDEEEEEHEHERYATVQGIKHDLKVIL